MENQLSFHPRLEAGGGLLSPVEEQLPEPVQKVGGDFLKFGALVGAQLWGGAGGATVAASTALRKSATGVALSLTEFASPLPAPWMARTFCAKTAFSLSRQPQRDTVAS